MGVDTRIDMCLRGFDQIEVPRDGCRAVFAPVLVVQVQHLLPEMVRVDVGVIIGGPVGYLVLGVARTGASEAGVEDTVAAVFGALGQCDRSEESEDEEGNSRED